MSLYRYGSILWLFAYGCLSHTVETLDHPPKKRQITIQQNKFASILGFVEHLHFGSKVHRLLLLLFTTAISFGSIRAFPRRIRTLVVLMATIRVSELWRHWRSRTGCYTLWRGWSWRGIIIRRDFSPCLRVVVKVFIKCISSSLIIVLRACFEFSFHSIRLILSSWRSVGRGRWFETLWADSRWCGAWIRSSTEVNKDKQLYNVYDCGYKYITLSNVLTALAQLQYLSNSKAQLWIAPKF